MKRNHSKAFTLIELLVVVAIIVALLAILMPSMGRAIEVAERAVCQSNLHQQGIAMASYGSDSFGKFPGAHSKNGVLIWMTRLRQYASDAEAVFNCPTAPQEDRWTATFGSGLAADGYGWRDDEVRITRLSRFTYGYNDWGINEGWWTGGVHLGLGTRPDDNRTFTRQVSMGEIVSPSNMVAIGDSTTDGDWDGIMDPNDIFVTGVTGEHPGSRHDEGANMVFVDGHTQWDLQENWRVRPGEDGAAERARRWNNDNQPHVSYWFPQHNEG